MYPSAGAIRGTVNIVIDLLVSCTFLKWKHCAGGSRYVHAYFFFPKSSMSYL